MGSDTDDTAHISDPDGNRYVRYLYWDGSRWKRNYNWLENDWDSHNPSASLANLSVSLPSKDWESFVF